MPVTICAHARSKPSIGRYTQSEAAKSDAQDRLGDIADPAADLDKDGQTSLLEAFLAASHQAESFYKEHGRL
jgi:hypothetical protein